MLTYIKNSINTYLFSHKVLIEKDLNKFTHKQGTYSNEKIYREQIIIEKPKNIIFEKFNIENKCNNEYENNIGELINSENIKYNIYLPTTNVIQKNVTNIVTQCVNSENFYNEEFLNKFNNNEIEIIKKNEIIVESMAMRHPIISFSNRINDTFGQIRLTHGNISPILYVQEYKMKFSINKCFVDSNFYKSTENSKINTSICDITLNKNKNLSYALLESNNYSKYSIDDLDILEVFNNDHKIIIIDIMKKYDVKNINELNDAIKKELLEHNIYKIDGKFKMLNDDLGNLNQSIWSNRLNDIYIKDGLVEFINNKLE